jgi:hypothetical protein
MPSQNLDGWGLDNMYTMSSSQWNWAFCTTSLLIPIACQLLLITDNISEEEGLL